MTLIELLMREEGWSPHVYKDHLGYYTIGYGHLVDERKGGKISKEIGLIILLIDIEDKKRELDLKIPWWSSLDETRREILIAMAFQLGVAGLLQFKNTLKAIRAKDFTKAANGMRASLWARQTPGRAERMAQAMETGVLS